MRVKSFAGFFSFTALWLLTVITAVSAPAADPIAIQSADSLYHQASLLLNSGDTTQATAMLDRVLGQDKKHYEALLMRGRLYLAAGDKNRAKAEFKLVLGSGNDRLRSRAWIALGDVETSDPNRIFNALLKEYLFAIKADPTYLEAYYHRAELAFELGDLKGDGDPKGYRIASRMLLYLIFTEPTYKEVYPTWRDRILDKTWDEKRRVAGFVESYVKSYPQHVHWLLDAAEYRYEIDEIEQALVNLNALEQGDSTFRPVDRLLLRARCLVELSDTTGFEEAYREALEAAAGSGKFSRLVAHAQAIFLPGEEEKAALITSAEEWTDFLRAFWSRRDPDPLTPRNERLYEHYRRLRVAQRDYGINDIYSRARVDRAFFKMENVMSRSVGYMFEYDPEIFYQRCPELALQQRGLLYIRHGPPDYINKLVMEYDITPIEEIWYYGRVMFLFMEGHSSIGDFVYAPLPVRDVGNITRAMETESYEDPVSTLRQDLYAVEFMTTEGAVEYEVYQGAPLDEFEGDEVPIASAAVFDPDWQELARDSSASFRTEIDNRDYWIGVNRFRVEPGPGVLAARLETPGRTAVFRHDIDLKPYRSAGLELSGIVVGSPVKPGMAAHSRRGIELLPRPSMQFSAGEIMTVYLEIYGLSVGERNTGRYTERVTVTRVGGEQGIIGKVFSVFRGGGKRTSSLTLSFERELARPGKNVAEYFTLDTSLLLPGKYRMAIEVADANSRGRRKVGCTFKLE